MSSTHYAHLRISPSSARKVVVKTARSGPLSAPVKATVKGSGKVKQTTDKVKEEDPEILVAEDEDDDMTTGFLQFWCGYVAADALAQMLMSSSTTCDRQILVPKDSLLYCSERYAPLRHAPLNTFISVMLIRLRPHSCKRMDAEHVTSYSSYTSLKSPTSSDDIDTDVLGSTKRSPVERARPTPRPMLSTRIPPKAHEGKSDLDPTEWKPKLPHRPSSEASQFLGQFHRTPPASHSPRRPAAVPAQTTSSVPMTAPSLSATPSASSMSSSSDSVAGTPYDFLNRPLMRRCHDPLHSNSAAVKSPNIVTPRLPSAYSVPAKPKGGSKKVAAPPAAVSENVALASDLSYEKKWDLPRFHGSWGLATLLGSASLEHKAAM
ncbi:MAG: hypothetical protein LQ338_000269 [Usnochroma carphineum]|nr:MAG: hypothetical protein LQ338_000269 [Usnochroma carphineum]